MRASPPPGKEGTHGDIAQLMDVSANGMCLDASRNFHKKIRMNLPAFRILLIYFGKAKSNGIKW